MADQSDELEEALNELLKKYTKGCLCVEGTIETVNQDFTCDVKTGDSIHSNVPLKVLVGNQASVIEIPTAGSDCLMIFRDNNISRPQILWIDKSDKLLINCQSLVEFNGGKLGGMVKVIDLVTKLNALEKAFNAHLNKYNTHIHSGVTSGPGTSAVPTVQDTNQLPITVRANIENTKITQ